MIPGKLITLIVDVLIGLAILAVVVWFGRGALGFLQAPAQLDAALGNNAALKTGIAKQNEATKKREAEGKRRKDESRKAVEAAGQPQAKRAQEILVTPCTWATTDYECARGRFIRELGLK